MRQAMIQILTSDVMLRFFGGFAIGCVLVLSGAFERVNGLA
jgi:hypothetical protein